MKMHMANIPVTILREGKRFVAYSPVFDLSTSGPTQKQVKKRFIEAIQLFMEELVRTETLDKVLAELGWTKHAKDKTWQPPTLVSQKAERIRVPAAAAA